MVQSQVTTEWTVGGLARAANVGVETIRYYQRRGLIAEPPRQQGSGLGGGFRRYSVDDLRRLRFIRSAQAAGFTLEEIGELLQLDAIGDRSRVRAMAKSRLAELDRKMRELRQVKNALTRLVDQCASGDGDACPILTAFDQTV